MYFLKHIFFYFSVYLLLSILLYTIFCQYMKNVALFRFAVKQSLFFNKNTFFYNVNTVVQKSFSLHMSSFCKCIPYFFTIQNKYTFQIMLFFIKINIIFYKINISFSKKVLQNTKKYPKGLFSHQFCYFHSTPKIELLLFF